MKSSTIDNEVDGVELSTIKDPSTNANPHNNTTTPDADNLADVQVPSVSRLTWWYEWLEDWVFTTVIGVLVVSFWRGSWVLIDLYSCDQSADASVLQGDSFCYTIDVKNVTRTRSAWISYLVGDVLLAIAVHVSWKYCPWIPKTTDQIVTSSLAVMRACFVYVLGLATVNIWRGIWYLTDAWVFPFDPIVSWWTTTVIGALAVYCVYAGPSLLAPPAIFNLDGPGLNPPPLVVTILSSYFSITLPASVKPPATPRWVQIADVVGSFLFLPIAVVWFWRGCWLLQDLYLWGLTTAERDFHRSLLESIVMAYCLLILGSDDIGTLLTIESAWKNWLVGRVRTLLLAVGTVSFWRAIWLMWDEFVGGTSYLSAWLSHIGGALGLLMLGCFASITAPPSTLGVDAIAHEDCSDEPLFQDVPVPAETLHFLAIGRQPVLEEVESEPLRLDEGADSRIELLRHRSLVEMQRPEFASIGSPRLSRRNVMSCTNRQLHPRNASKRLKNKLFRSR